MVGVQTSMGGMQQAIEHLTQEIGQVSNNQPWEQENAVNIQELQENRR